MLPKHKSIIVLEALLEEQPVKFPDDDHTYMFLDGIFGVTAVRTNTAKPGVSEAVLLGVDMNLSHFIKLCEEIPDEKVLILGSETILRRINKARAEKRRVGTDES